MNNERAIEILKTIRHNSTMQTDYTIDDIDQALDIAIESLERDRETKEKMWAKQLNECEECEVINNEWVDVRDRLPSDDEIAENYGEFEITYFDTILKHQVTIAEFCKSNKYAIVEKDERGYWYDWEDDEIINVIAWRPLPQPYERKE